MTSNPFAALKVENKISSEKQANLKVNTTNLNGLLEEIFGFTLNQENFSERQLIYLEEVSTNFKTKTLDTTILQHALFDRLFMCAEDNSVLESLNFNNAHNCEIKVLTYLYQCYKATLENSKLEKNDQLKIIAIILQNVATALIQSEIYSQQLEIQLIEILKSGEPFYDLFFKESCEKMLTDEDGGEIILTQKLSDLLSHLIQEIHSMDINTFNYNIFNILNLFASEEYLAKILLNYKPTKFVSGADYSFTLIGALLNISVLPKGPHDNYIHFQNPNDAASIMATEQNLWSSVNNLTRQIHVFIKTLLTGSPMIKNKMLEWLGLFLKSNSDRGKIWNVHQPIELNPSLYTTVSDGLMVNLGNVLLRLCQPFCSNFNDNKILKVNPTYCAVSNDNQLSKNIHLDVYSQTCLIPKINEEDQIKSLETYNFVTECFFMAHRSINLGFQVGVDKLVQMNQQIGRLERGLADAAAQAANSDVVSQLKQRLTQELTKYLSLKTQLTDPNFLQLMFDFISSSCHWLCQVAISTDQWLAKPLEVSFPLSDNIPNSLKCIPEFLVENIVTYLVFLRRFNPKVFEEVGYEKMKPIITFVLIYMGSSERVKNPHVRARLAEALDSLLPYHQDSPLMFNSFGGYQRELLFTQHEHRTEIVESLLNVFVGIEMTGQSVEFEQKFNYRRPMYSIIDYLWTKDEYQNSFRLLAENAEKNMDAVSPPLFLRFINLLINDAVYLLDESLTNMAKLKEMQMAKQNGEWDSLSAQERAQNLSNMQHVGMIAKFDNILGRDTIKTLKQITSKITIVFTHPTLIDRIASMLNYFLYNLVGPKKTKFKVKDQKEYSFDPAATVLIICEIYVNLKDDDEFCLAISRDGRSYSPQLFEFAEDVLIRIGGNILIDEMKTLASKVADKTREQLQNEEATAEAPEEYLDPIMSTLMMDPVILPSSKQIVDRTTIARHLLSDQTDPFNREPLSMDQVIPNMKLAVEIRNWLKKRNSQNKDI